MENGFRNGADSIYFRSVPSWIKQIYHAQDEGIQPMLMEIRTILKSALPEAEERISWSMPTYWKGRNIIHFAASKNHLGIYPGEEAVAVFADELLEYSVSKGTIRVPYGKPLPTELIEKIARWCYEKHSK